MEEWRDILGYEGLYQVSNFGRVKSLRERWGETRILKPCANKFGYLYASLSKDGKLKHFFIHRLIAEAFIENSEHKPQINHRDGDKLNNRVDNLEWVTPAENVRHAVRVGLRKSGENSVRAKLSNEQAAQIRQNPNNLTGRQLAKKFGVDKKTIADIQRGEKYRDADGSVREKIDTRIPDDVREKIRAEYKPGVYGCGSYVLAKKYGIACSTISNIIHE